jgi:hypothetical protein
MRRVTIIIIIVSLTSNLFCQSDTISKKEQKRLVIKAQTLSYGRLSIKPINDLLESDQITYTDLIFKLKLMQCDDIIYKSNLSMFLELTDTVTFLKNVNYYLDCLNEITKESECDQYYYSLFVKYKFFTDLKKSNNLDNKYLIELYKKDLKELESVGFYPEVEGFGSGISIIKSHDIWIGAEFSVYNYNWFELSKLKTTCNGKTHTEWVNDEFFKMVKAFTIGYNRSVETKYNDFSISLIDFCSPVYIAPLKFGLFQNNVLKNNNFYYSPMIGVSFGPVSLIYSYKYYFSKQARTTYDKNYFIVKLSYAINDFWGNRHMK